MPVTTVNVTGTLLDPEGGALFGYGIISLQLSGSGYTNDGVDDQQIVGKQSYPVANGSIDIRVVPCSSITLFNGDSPRWIVTYNVPGYSNAVEVWNLGATDPIDIGSIPKD